MTYRMENERLIITRMRENGSTLTIDKQDHTQHDLWRALEMMAEGGTVEAVDEDAQYVTYRLRLDV